MTDEKRRKKRCRRRFESIIIIPAKLTFSVVWDRVVITLNVIQY